MNLNLFNQPIGDGVNFFDTPTVAFARDEFVILAQRQFMDICPEATFASVISPNGYVFLRCHNEDHNKTFMAFLKEHFDGACTFHNAISYS